MPTAVSFLNRAKLTALIVLLLLVVLAAICLAFRGNDTSALSAESIKPQPARSLQERHLKYHLAKNTRRALVMSEQWLSTIKANGTLYFHNQE